MKKISKLMSLILVVVLSLSALLTGCGSKPAGSSSAAPASSPAPASSSAPASKSTDWPKKTIQIVVPANAGGDTDFNARAQAKYLEKELGQPVVIVNVGGAGGTLGSQKVKDAAPDGYTVLAFHSSMLINEAIGMTNYGFRDFEMGGIMAMEPGNMFFSGKNSQFKTLKDLIDYAKANPGKVKYGTEIGGFTHIQGLIFQDLAGIKMNIVDAGTASQKVAALKGGQVDIMPNVYGASKQFIDTGDFLPLAVLTGERVKKYDKIPTAKEQGIDLVVTKPYFFLFPKGTPKEIVDKFTKAAENVTKNKDYAADIDKAYSLDPFYMNPADSTKFLTDQFNLFKKYADALKTK